MQKIFFGDDDAHLHGDQGATSWNVWRVNLARSAVLAIVIVTSISVAAKLDKVISLAGVLLGMSNVLIIPAICHYKLCANTLAHKVIDIGIIIAAGCMLVLGPYTIISSW